MSSQKGQTPKKVFKKENLKKVLTEKNSFDRIKKLKQAKNFEN